MRWSRIYRSHDRHRISQGSKVGSITFYPGGNIQHRGIEFTGPDEEQLYIIRSCELTAIGGPKTESLAAGQDGKASRLGGLISRRLISSAFLLLKQRGLSRCFTNACLAAIGRRCAIFSSSKYPSFLLCTENPKLSLAALYMI